MKTTIISLVLMALLSTTVFGASVGMLRGNYDYGVVEIGETYMSKTMGAQPFESDCLRDGYTQENCPYTIDVKMSYPEYTRLIGIEDNFTSLSWVNHFFEVELTVPEQEAGEYDFMVCGHAIEGIFRIGACNILTYTIEEPELLPCDNYCRKLKSRESRLTKVIERMKRNLVKLEERLERIKEKLEEYE